eukprot:g34354.t1
MCLCKGSLENDAMFFVKVHPEQLRDTGHCALRSVSQMHAKTNISYAWRSINSVKDALWSARTLLVFQNNELTLTQCCRLAHSKFFDEVTRKGIEDRAVDGVYVDFIKAFNKVPHGLNYSFQDGRGGRIGEVEMSPGPEELGQSPGDGSSWNIGSNGVIWAE